MIATICIGFLRKEKEISVFLFATVSKYVAIEKREQKYLEANNKFETKVIREMKLVYESLLNFLANYKHSNR